MFLIYHKLMLIYTFTLLLNNMLPLCQNYCIISHGTKIHFSGLVTSPSAIKGAMSRKNRFQFSCQPQSVSKSQSSAAIFKVREETEP